jgi:3D (Asp-Asp-Asp) domain-containing protein
MTPYPRPHFSHAARAIRARIWQRCRPHLAFLCAITLAFALCVLLAPRAKASEGRWVTVEATAYCPCSLCCEGSDDGITANGTKVSDVAYGVASSPNIPFHSRIYVPIGAGYLDVSRHDNRWFTVDDRGGALRSEWSRSGITRIDLRYKSHASAQQFGRKLMLVFITN